MHVMCQSPHPAYPGRWILLHGTNDGEEASIFYAKGADQSSLCRDIAARGS